MELKSTLDDGFSPGRTRRASKSRLPVQNSGLESRMVILWVHLLRGTLLLSLKQRGSDSKLKGNHRERGISYKKRMLLLYIAKITGL